MDNSKVAKDTWSYEINQMMENNLKIHFNLYSDNFQSSFPRNSQRNRRFVSNRATSSQRNLIREPC